MQTLKVLKNAEGLALRINHFLFWWYYNKVDDHFKQYTFFKSISLLRQNYDHLKTMYDGNNQLLSNCIKRNTELEHQLSNARIAQIATDGQIRWANENFGTKWTPPTEN